MRGWERVFAALAAVSLASCAGAPTGSALPFGNAPSPLTVSPIQHVVFIVQENRSPDYLFQGLPGADIAKSGIDSSGKRIPLRQISLAAPYDVGHGYESFMQDYDNGKMDGWGGRMHGKYQVRMFGYAPPSEVQPYHDMAEQYTFGDHMFQSNRGPSFPAHLYLVSGTAGDASMQGYRVEDNAYDRTSGIEKPGECGSPVGIINNTISLATGSKGPTVRPCFDHAVLSDLLDEKGVSWRYYQMGPDGGRWHALNAIRHIRYGPDWANVVTPSPQVLTDIHSGKLANVSWVMPGDSWSDHAGKHGTANGPAWVAAIVNAIGESDYWKNTAIFVVWDDWGGWYDHVKPQTYNHYELGFRVPLIVISPYAKEAYVSKAQHEFGSLLAFAEETFGIPKGSLRTTDWRADDLRDCFDFTQNPRAFVPIKAPAFKATYDRHAYDED